MRILSHAYSRSVMPTFFLSSCEAFSAATFIRFDKSAPEKPGVARAIVSRSTDSSSGTGLAYSCRICLRPATSGSGTVTRLSKRPGRTSARSSASGKLVAASTITPAFCWNPSISTRSWLRVIFIACWSFGLRCDPMASISSMKMIAGELASASSKTFRRPASDSPERLDMTSGPLIVWKCTPVSDLTACAIIVLPEPGGPTSSTPRGGRTPISSKTTGCISGRSTSSRSVDICLSRPPMSS
mmetsp:Transcript_32540/g.85518  ORF Transcript_32540/g.85518 Transcript_32540/m.85518 type:complete len:242 (+) Transcript_32540:1324-2049(+)